jgi:hypothetical protein
MQPQEICERNGMQHSEEIWTFTSQVVQGYYEGMTLDIARKAINI